MATDTPPAAQRNATARTTWRRTPRWLLVVALLGTAAAVALRVYATVAAGPLWRDEAGSASTATVATLAELWARQPLDSFPILWQLLLRGWTLVWNGGDVAIRSLGALISLALLPALWWTSRSFRVVPLASLAFAGVAPTFVVWAGFQNRAYGLGVTLLALLVGAVWRMAAAPAPSSITLATVLAVLAVHTTYHLPVMLAALLGAAVVVGARRRAWSVIFAAGGVGVVAAASLLVYTGVLAQTRVYAKVVYATVTLPAVLRGFVPALAPGGDFVVWAFVVLAVAACAWGALFALRAAWSAPRDPSRGGPGAGDAVAFAVTAAALALLGQVAFLLSLRFLVQPWYYATVVLVVAIAIDVVLQRGVALARVRDAIAAAIALVLLASTPIAFGASGLRLSNLDLVARDLGAKARPGDLIVVYPWHWGVSFDRYYDGAAPFMTVPDVANHEFHRFDQLQELMRDPERIKPGFRRIHQTLEAGNRVWVVGRPVADVPEQFPVLPPPSDADPASWRDGYYTAVAGLQLAWVLQQSSPQATVVTPPSGGPVSDYEDASVTLYQKPR